MNECIDCGDILDSHHEQDRGTCDTCFRIEYEKQAYLDALTDKEQYELFQHTQD